MDENKKKKSNIKCRTCEHYEKDKDFCKERCIEYCTKQVNTDFSQCSDYLIREDLIMY